jgi:hypothetical protein
MQRHALLRACTYIHIQHIHTYIHTQEWAIDAASCPVEDELFLAALFITRLTQRIASFSRYLLSVWAGQQPGFDVWANAFAPRPANRSVCLSIYLSIYLSICLSVFLCILRLSIAASVCVSVCRDIYLSVCLTL